MAVDDKLIKQWIEDEKKRRGIQPSRPSVLSTLGSAIGSAAQTADDAARAFANTISFGQADRLAKAMPEWLGGEPDAYERSQAAWERSPNASRAAQIAGYAVPVGRISNALSTVPIIRKGVGGLLAREGIEGGILSSGHQIGEEGTWDLGRTVKDSALSMLGMVHPIARTEMVNPAATATQINELLSQLPTKSDKAAYAPQEVSRNQKSDQLPTRQRRGPLPEIDLPVVAGWPYQF